ncbi:MAG: hypothetical protein EX267_04855 [Acidimicrobiia bacterium]|nr:MAG: hypothetical protein EX267_04855 [Acidimicrobiia bacterium]
MHPPPTKPDARLGFGTSVVLALLIVIAVASANGGLTGLLTVGEDFPIRPFVEADFGAVELATGDGHDGQQYYGIARDPFGTGEVPDLVDNPSYRYLHILYPLLAGGFGLFSPAVTLWLMAALAVLGFGVSGAAALRIARQLGGGHTVVLLALVNVGLLLAVRFLLPDTLALALSLIGVSLALEGRDRPAGVALALAVLAKTTYFVFPLALGAWVWRSDRARAVALTVLPAVPAGLWMGYVFARFGASTAGNLAVPFTGLIGAIDLWSEVSSGEVAMALGALLLVGIGVVLAARTRHELLRWLLLAWVGVALISSEFVWEFGNNTLRVLAPLWSLAAVAGSVYLSSRTSRKNLPV